MTDSAACPSTTPLHYISIELNILKFILSFIGLIISVLVAVAVSVGEKDVRACV